MTQSPRTDTVVHVGTVSLDLSPPQRPDGYRELAVALQAWGNLTGYRGPREHLWLVLTAARRLDTAHRQIERVREGFGQLKEIKPNPMRRMEETLAVLGDAQLAMIALYRAASAAERITPYVTVPFPALVKQRMEGLKQLRDAFEHADDRALGYVSRREKDPEKAWKSMVVFGKALIGTREIRYRKWSLGIDKPATGIFLSLRRFIRKAWLELCHADFESRHQLL